jgi:hypothetical protein
MNEGGRICLILPCPILTMPLRTALAFRYKQRCSSFTPLRWTQSNMSLNASICGCCHLKSVRIVVGQKRFGRWVRRFRCRYCLQTVSLLPSFAQPYRFIQNRTIEIYSFGQPFPDEVNRHLDLLSRYWKRFCLWLPEIERTLGHALERAPPIDQLKAWRFLLAAHGNLAATTQNLVAAFQITPFGRYRCHRPNGPKEAMVGRR